MTSFALKTLKEPTSKDQKATSLRTIDSHKPVIPVVTFLIPLAINSVRSKLFYDQRITLLPRTCVYSLFSFQERLQSSCQPEPLQTPYISLEQVFTLKKLHPQLVYVIQLVECISMLLL